MSRSLFAKLPLLALGLVLALTATGCSSGTRGSTGGYVSADGSVTTVDPGDRKALPELSGPDLDGKTISSADYEGKILVINAWGSWCAPCRREAPVLRQVDEDRPEVQFLGLLQRDKAASAKAFNDSKNITYPSIVDSGGKQVAKFVDSLPALAIPTTWIIDGRGRVAARLVTDDLTVASLEGLIDYAKKSGS